MILTEFIWLRVEVLLGGGGIYEHDNKPRA
jgi:hypothetical protein